MASHRYRRHKSFHDKNKHAKEDKDFFVFGYSCKLFRDDETAFYIDQGKHLIPWMGDETLLIDRYDGRSHLSDFKHYDSELIQRHHIEKTSVEKALEEQCDRERYLELSVDLDEERTKEEEEWKRYYEAVNEGAFNAVGFSYDEYDPSEPTDSDFIEVSKSLDEPYSIPEGLTIPPDTALPISMKHHTIIEKTASCIASHGAQMEIMIKAKQANNPQFDFLHYDHQLFPYFKHLVQVIKSGHYVPPSSDSADKNDDTAADNSSYEDDDHEENDHYLHPSLFPTNTEATKSLPTVSIEGTAYGHLVQNLKSKLPPPVPSKPVKKETEEATKSATNVERPSDSCPVSPASRHSESPSSSSDSSDVDEEVSYGPTLQQPPPDLQPIIERMAQYVVKNGPDFEIVVRRKNDPRFTFIEHGNLYNPYYEFKKNFFQKEKEEYDEEQRIAEEAEKLAEEQRQAAMRSVSFSLKTKAKEPEPNVSNRLTFHDESSDDNGDDKSRLEDSSKSAQRSHVSSKEIKSDKEKIRDRLSSAARNRSISASKDKLLQAERKKKAAMFVNMLKSTAGSEIQSNANCTDHDSRSSTPRASAASSPSSRRYNYSSYTYDPSLSNPKGQSAPSSSSHKRSRSRDKSPLQRHSSKSKSSKRTRSPSRKHKSHKSHKSHHGVKSETSSSTDKLPSGDITTTSVLPKSRIPDPSSSSG